MRNFSIAAKAPRARRRGTAGAAALSFLRNCRGGFLRVAVVSPRCTRAFRRGSTAAPSACVLPHRGAGRRGPRRHAVRERATRARARAARRWRREGLRLDPACAIRSRTTWSCCDEVVAAARTSSTSSTSTSTTCTFRCAAGSAMPAVTTLHGRLDLPGAGAALPALSPTCRWSRSRDASAGRCRGRLGGNGPSRPAGEPAPFSAQPRRLPRVPRAHLAGEAPGPGDRDRARAGMPLQDRGEDRPRRPGSTSSDDDRAAAERTGVEFIGEIGESDKDALPRRRARRCSSRSTGPSPSAW